MRAVLAVLIVLSASGLRVDAADLLLFPAGLNYKLVEEGDAWSARIPITPTSETTALEELEVRLRDVVFHEGRAESLAKLLTVKIDAGDAQRGASLVVESKSLATTPGSYVVWVDITRKKAADTQKPSGESSNSPAPKPQAVSLTLQKPAPQVVMSGPLIVEQTYFLASPSNQTGPLRISEQSRKTSLSGVGFTDVRDPDANVELDTGKLSVSLKNQKIAAGTTEFADVKVEGEFRLGKSTGKLELRADQLETPLTVAYEVRARRSALWIAIITGLGFFIGWLLRKGLKKWQELAQARAGASLVMRQINDAADQSPDMTYQEELTAARNAFRNRSSSRDAAVVVAATTEAGDALKTARANLNQRRDKVVAALEPYRSLMRRQFEIPPGAAAEALTKLRGSVNEMSQLAERRDYAQALVRLERVSDEELRPLVNAIGDWQKALTGYLDALARESPPLLPDGLAQLKKANESWQATFKYSQAHVTSTTVDVASQTLENAHGAYSAARSLTQQVGQQTEELAQWAVERLNPLVTAQARLAEFVPFARQTAMELVADIDGPDASVLSGRRRQAAAHWDAVLLSLFVQPPAEQVAQDVRAALFQSNWLDAIEKTEAELKKARATGGQMLNNEPAAPAGSAARHPVAPTLTWHAALVRFEVESPLRADVIVGTTWEQQEFLREATRIGVIQSICLCALFTVVAYVLYEGKWVGTDTEMLGLFLWAFGVDVTSEAIMAAAKNIKLPS